MRDATHEEYIKRWAEFVRKNPHSWKKQHSQFINAQFLKAKKIHEKLRQSPQGREKLEALRKL